jgi:hypothetical protein
MFSTVNIIAQRIASSLPGLSRCNAGLRAKARWNGCAAAAILFLLSPTTRDIFRQKE